MHLFRRGMRDGISIALGYLSVSFSFGILSVQSGLTVWQAVLISLTNLTSAGQVAGVGLIASQSSMLELFMAEVIINIRYSLMSLVLSQKADSSFRVPHRLLASFGITDEIFAVASIQKETVKPAYWYGLMIVPFFGWTIGTLLGAAAGTILPVQITNALGIALYGMFLAIILPPARKSKAILAVISMSALISVLLHVTLKSLSGGFIMIIAALSASILGAIFFPVPEDQMTQEAET